MSLPSKRPRLQPPEANVPPRPSRKTIGIADVLRDRATGRINAPVFSPSANAAAFRSALPGRGRLDRPILMGLGDPSNRPPPVTEGLPWSYPAGYEFLRWWDNRGNTYIDSAMLMLQGVNPRHQEASAFFNDLDSRIETQNAFDAVSQYDQMSRDRPILGSMWRERTEEARQENERRREQHYLASRRIREEHDAVVADSDLPVAPPPELPAPDLLVIPPPPRFLQSDFLDEDYIVPKGTQPPAYGRNKFYQIR